jgi:hypothetical protein
MGGLIEEVRLFSVELRDNWPFSLMIEEGVQQELGSPAHVMDMRELGEGDIRLPVHRHGMAKRRIGDPIHRRHPDDRSGE